MSLVKQLFWKKLLLNTTFQIVFAAVLGISFGLIISSLVESVDPAIVKLIELPGTMWLRALKAVVLPLIMASMITSVYSLRNIPGTGAKLAKYTISYYVITTFISSIEGAIWLVLLLQPNLSAVNMEGMAAVEGYASQEGLEQRTVLDQIRSMFLDLIPSNVVEAIAQDALLAVIVTSMIIGLLIEDSPENPSIMLKFAREVEKIIFRVIHFLIALAPIGIFFLIMPQLISVDLAAVIKYLGVYVGTIYFACFVHIFVIYPLVYFLFTRQNPFAFLSGCLKAIITAFGTSSSAASLSVAMECADELKIPGPVSKFTLPLGATINKDGTGLGYPISICFMAATQGITLTFGQIALLCIVSTLASIGTSPIPSSGIILTMMVMESVGIPMTPMFGYVVAFDFLLDRPQTVANVTGDLIATGIVTKCFHLEDLKEETV